MSSSKILIYLNKTVQSMRFSGSNRMYHGMPFLDFYEKTSGNKISKEKWQILNKKHPNLNRLQETNIHYTLKILEKFNISPLEACQHIHLFSMNPISVDNYAEILKECGFVKIVPNLIIRYHTTVRARTISELKQDGLIREDLVLETHLYNMFQEWPESTKTLENYKDETTSILMIRMSILEKYLQWRLSVTSDEFQKFCRNYLPLKHKPMSDIREALDLAQNVIQFDKKSIRRNGFLISSDPINTKLIIDNVKSLAGLDIHEVIRIEPAIIKNNYRALIQIRNLLEEYRIPEKAQRRCLRVFCMRPETVKERLDELKNLKEFEFLSTNPRMLSMVVHKKKMLDRMNQIHAANKHCYSLNHLVASNSIFNSYISSFGSKTSGRDIAALINSSLQLDVDLTNQNATSVLHEHTKNENSQTDTTKIIADKLKRNKYWLYSALNVINENLRFLKKNFSDQTIFNNCQILLYPVFEVTHQIEFLIAARANRETKNRRLEGDANINSLRLSELTDDQILSLVLYEIERKYHFSGNGVWQRNDAVKVETSHCS